MKVKPRITFSSIAIILMIVILSSCSSMGTHTVSISERDLQKKIAEQFSLPISVLKVFDINLTNPVIHLDGEHERLYAELDSSIDSPLSGRPLHGKIGISGQLKFDKDSNQIILSESRLENLKFDGMNEEYNNLINAIGRKMGGILLNNIPLYTLSDNDLRFGSTYYVPKDFKVTGNNLVIRLEPK